MPVTLHCNQLFQNRQELYQFLSICQQTSCAKECHQIVSISLKINAIDPLAILHELAEPTQLNFYFEKQDLATKEVLTGQKTAIAAIDSTAQFCAEGRDRFHQVKAFIQSTLSSIILAGDLQQPFAGPHFFCSFSFTPNPQLDAAKGFPAAMAFLPQWQIANHEQGCTVVINLKLDHTTPIQTVSEQIWQKLQQIQAIRYRLVTPMAQPTPWLQTPDQNRDRDFKQAVQSALESIHQRAFHKIVLSHAVDVCSPLDFERTYSLNNLRQLYPDCYVFSVSNGQGQSFIGASPERLVRLKDHQLLTDALAGSAPRGQTAYEDAHFANGLLNSTKEIHEHQVVIDFIKRQLAELGLEPTQLPLRLLQLSNIQHLHTPIRAAVPAQIHLLDILQTLHPTPAVAGMPREIACEQILRYETFERSLYAAPIGWVNYQGEGEFAVGIRSALLDGCHARLFAGAGIVAGSDPERELAEVQLKLQALLSALV